MSDKQWKSCSGPFWAECHADMEAQEARIRALEAACRKMAKAINDVCSEVDWPELTNTMRQGLGCGVEDRGIHDRYEAAEYGYEDALERCADFIKNATNDAAKDPLAAKFIEEARNG